MTVIVLGPAEALSTALADAIGSVTVVDSFAGADDTMWQALLALQSAYTSMAAHGGRIVVVLPTIGIAGAAGLVGLTTAIEGIRAMAKSAARQWGSAGIAVNMVAAPIRIFAPSLTTADAHLTAAAISDDNTLIPSIVATTKFLLQGHVTHLIGETIIVDGGSAMVP